MSQDPEQSFTHVKNKEKVDHQVEILTKAFAEIDRNHDDMIDEQELEDFIKTRGQDVDEDVIHKLFKTLDFNHDKQISM
jgi:Ca2+-binding EF-hand superfamily protein